MNMKNILPKLGVTLLLIIGVASCEEEFSTIDTNIVGEFEELIPEERTVTAYSKVLGGVQSNALPVYQMGIYNDPVYGKSTVNLLAQLQFPANATDPSFGDCTVLDRVFLYLPFFSEATVEDDDEVTYTLDSIYGNSPVTIKIYESNFFLRDQDPSTDFEERQKYFSNQKDEFEGFLGELLATVDDFTPSASAIAINDSTDIAPGLRVELPVQFFQEKVIDKEGEPELINNNNFKEFFRGLYFEVTSNNDDGSHFIFNLADPTNGNIGVTMYTSFKDLESGQDCDTEGVEVETAETRLLFDAIAVNVFDNELPQEIIDATQNPNIAQGEETLYLRGGEGIITVVDLFGTQDADNNGVADELDDLRDEEWIINEANLIFYVDQSKVTPGETEPERLFIFDTKNNRVLADYQLDLTSNQLPIDAITEHMGRLERGSDDDGDFYKIRITTHVSNLINRDSTNIPLGLMVSQNVSQLDFQDVETELLPAGIDEIPASSIVSPEGTVLHGNRSTNADKRLKLQIYYTKPE